MKISARDSVSRYIKKVLVDGKEVLLSTCTNIDTDEGFVEYIRYKIKEEQFIDKEDHSVDTERENTTAEPEIKKLYGKVEIEWHTPS